MARAATLAVLAVLAACGAHAPVHAPPRVTVIEPGAQPRLRLRLAAAVGASRRVESHVMLRRVERTTDTTLLTRTRSGEAPALRVVTRAEVAELFPDGSARVVAIVDEASLLDGVADPTLAAAVARMVGTRSSFRRAPNGAISEVQGTPRDAPEELRRLFEASRTDLVMFPDEDVGPGASWRVTSHQVIAGIRWERTATYRLRELAGSVATLDVDAAMRAGSQPVSVEPNATIRLDAGAGTVTGTLVVALDGPAVAATYREALTLDLAIVMKHLRIGSHLESTVEVRSELRP